MKSAGMIEMASLSIRTSWDDVAKTKNTSREDGWAEMSSEAIRAACVSVKSFSFLTRRRRYMMKPTSPPTDHIEKSKTQLANSPRDIPLRHPIFRRIYLVFFVFISLFFLMPFWCIIYLPRSNRPRPNWTLQRCLRVRWSRRLCGVVARCEVDYLGRDLDIDMVCAPPWLSFILPFSFLLDQNLTRRS